MDRASSTSDDTRLMEWPKASSKDVWMASCRPVSSMDEFSSRFLVFQPDTTSYCAKGPSCPRRNDTIHAMLYNHEIRVRSTDHTTHIVNASHVPNADAKKKPSSVRIPRVDQAWIVSKEWDPPRQQRHSTTTSQQPVVVSHDHGVANGTQRGVPKRVSGLFACDRDTTPRNHGGATHKSLEDGPLASLDPDSTTPLASDSTKPLTPDSTTPLTPDSTTPLTPDSTAPHTPNLTPLLHRIPGFPENRKVVLFVHGFSESYFRVVSYLNHYRARGGNSQGNPCLFAFTWPSQTASYHRAKLFYVKTAAKLLRRLINLLKSHGNEVVLLAHSMGCRVALRALYHSPVSVHTLILAAPGVHSHFLNNNATGECPSAKVAARYIKILYSRRDAMLRNGFWWAELMDNVASFKRQYQALGLVGPKGSDVGDNVESYDLTQDVSGHSLHFYLKHKFARSLVLDALEMADVRSELPAMSKL